MSYNAKLASTTEFGIVKVGSGLSITSGIISAALGLLNYGFVTSSVTQTNPVANAINIVSYNATGPANGVSVVGGTAITVVNAGTYTKTFTVNVTKADGGTDSISIWLRLNGVDIVGSRQDLALTTAANVFVTGSFTLNIPAGGNIQLCWSSSDTALSLTALPVAATPTRPTGFSAKVTLSRIS